MSITPGPGGLRTQRAVLSQSWHSWRSSADRHHPAFAPGLEDPAGRTLSSPARELALPPAAWRCRRLKRRRGNPPSAALSWRAIAVRAGNHHANSGGAGWRRWTGCSGIAYTPHRSARRSRQCRRIQTTVAKHVSIGLGTICRRPCARGMRCPRSGIPCKPAAGAANGRRPT
jgi:hypothetical protein